MEEKLKKYIELKDLGEVSGITELVDGNSSNHLNFKVTTSTGVYVARVTRSGDVLSYTNLSDEYVILKLVEKYNIGPKAITVDLEGFDTPLLIEEFLDGVSYGNLKNASEEIFEKTIELLVQTSNVQISVDEFPFKFSYTTFRTNFKVWDARMKEIEEVLGKEHSVILGFREIMVAAQKVLEEKDSILQNAPREFIYNDVHPGNLFWLASENKVKFIDWQKVSTGNPAFMICLFARRFGHLWGMNQTDFSKKVLNAYSSRKNIENLEELFYASILERAVSDMIWSVWADAKKKVSIKISTPEESKYYLEAKSLL